MHRRPLAPTRALSAAWARRLAVAAAIGAVASVAAAHHPRVPPRAALAGLALACAAAVLALCCGLRALRTIWRTGQPGLGRAVFGLGLAAVTLAYPASLAATLARAPLSAAASTAPEAPPSLSRSAKAIAARGGPPAATPGPIAAADPITLDMPAGDAFDTVEDAVKALRWRLVEAVPPGGRLGFGHIEAVAFSPVMHLPQDIAILIAPAAGQARVDVLSVARLGVTDFGEGAATIRQLGDAVAAQADD